VLLPLEPDIAAPSSEGCANGMGVVGVLGAIDAVAREQGGDLRDADADD
jgi:hypothetical protein